MKLSKCLDTTGAILEEQEGLTLPMSQVTGEQSVSTMRPYGVWAVISPFNFPLVLAAGHDFSGTPHREYGRI